MATQLRRGWVRVWTRAVPCQSPCCHHFHLTSSFSFFFSLSGLNIPSCQWLPCNRIFLSFSQPFSVIRGHYHLSGLRTSSSRLVTLVTHSVRLWMNSVEQERASTDLLLCVKSSHSAAFGPSVPSLPHWRRLSNALLIRKCSFLLPLSSGKGYYIFEQVVP